MCVSVRSFMSPHPSRPRNIGTCVFTATRKTLLYNNYYYNGGELKYNYNSMQYRVTWYRAHNGWVKQLKDEYKKVLVSKEKVQK